MTEILKLFRPVGNQFPITSPFGVTRTLTLSNGQTKTQVHHGIDFGVPIGTPVHAVYDGEIFITGWENDADHSQGLGYRIWQVINYETKPIYSWYGHLSIIKVKPHDIIKAGDLIALSGFNGAATGPHLHVQYRERDTGDWLDAEFTTMPTA